MSARRFAALAAMGALLAAPAAATSPVFSWGKPGVSLVQYRADAIECGREGYYLDVSHTEAARVFRAASGQLDAMAPMGAPQIDGTDPRLNPLTSDGLKMDPEAARSAEIATRQGQIVAGTRPDKRMRQVGQLMLSTIEQCLTGLGYHRFRLTEDQRHALGRLKRGSDARRAYLYRLASDPAVLSEQGA